MRKKLQTKNFGTLYNRRKKSYLQCVKNSLILTFTKNYSNKINLLLDLPAL